MNRSEAGTLQSATHHQDMQHRHNTVTASNSGSIVVGSKNISIISTSITPTTSTSSTLSLPTDNIVIDFGEPVVTSTIQFMISPTIPLTVTWSIKPTAATHSPSTAFDRAIISHDPFRRGVSYTLSVLPGGQTVSGAPVTAQSFDFSVPLIKTYLPLILKNH